MKNNLLTAVLTIGLGIGLRAQAPAHDHEHQHQTNDFGIVAPKHKHSFNENFHTLAEIRELLNSNYVKFMQDTQAYKFNVYKMFHKDKDVIAEFIYHHFNSKALNNTYFYVYTNSKEKDFSHLLASAPEKDLFFWNIDDNQEAIDYYLDSFHKHQREQGEKTVNLPPSAVQKKP
jgi:hypothetical protein